MSRRLAGIAKTNVQLAPFILLRGQFWAEQCSQEGYPARAIRIVPQTHLRPSVDRVKDLANFVEIVPL